MKKFISFLVFVLCLFILSSCQTQGGKVPGIDVGGTDAQDKYKLTVEGHTEYVYTDELKSIYDEGELVEVKTNILMDAEIEMYINNVRVPKTDSDGDYWLYKFYMHNCNSILTVKCVDGFKQEENYYRTIRFVNPEIKKITNIINFDYLVTNVPFYHIFENTEEYERFNFEVLGNIIVHPDVVGPNIEFYYIVLVVRKSNYNGNYLYHDFKYDLYGDAPKDMFDPAPVPVLAPMLEEDIFYAKFEDCLLIDFVFVPRINIGEYLDYNI